MKALEGPGILATSDLTRQGDFWLSHQAGGFLVSIYTLLSKASLSGALSYLAGVFPYCNSFLCFCGFLNKRYKGHFNT
ncbi:UNVERIFIED_CONTAM: hypothetical protein FKN15_029394 [Acipenser sinensis]